MKAVAIVASGSGGQASVVLDACLAARMPVAGLVLAQDFANVERLKLPILGGIERLNDLDFLSSYAIALGTGDAKLRRELAALIAERHGTLATVIHPAASVSKSATIGAGSMIAAGAVIGPNASIGRFCIVNTCASADHDNVLEDGVSLSPGAHLAGAVTLREDCFIGVGASAIPGVTIGRRVMVGAGATVVDDVPDDVTVVGTPARILKPKTR
jgi:sugar O-acyltransferase (sialic acid O-acetyltransferase NeuD family)